MQPEKTTNGIQRDDQVIVSLTTVDFRIEFLEPVIRSIIDQELSADRIVLYLSDEPYLLDKGIKPSEIPAFLRQWERAGKLEIVFTKNTGPYRKLLPSIRANFYKRCVVVTADDDTVYPSDWLSNLYSDYLQRQEVIAYRGHEMKMIDGELLPYAHWPGPNNNCTIANFATGKDGILYAPQFFDERVFSDDFMQVCPRGDDIWFKFLTVLTGTGTYIRCGTSSLPVVKNPVRKALWNINRWTNDDQLASAIGYFEFDLEHVLSNEGSGEK